MPIHSTTHKSTSGKRISNTRRSNKENIGRKRSTDNILKNDNIFKFADRMDSKSLASELSTWRVWKELPESENEDVYDELSDMLDDEDDILEYYNITGSIPREHIHGLIDLNAKIVDFWCDADWFLKEKTREGERATYAILIDYSSGIVRVARVRKKGKVRMFHGTNPSNIQQILKDGFKIDFDSEDMYMGSGIYFAEGREEAESYGKGIIVIDLKVNEDEMKEITPFSDPPYLFEQFQEEECEKDDSYEECFKKYKQYASDFRNDMLVRGIKVGWRYLPLSSDKEYVIYDPTILKNIEIRKV